MSGNLNNDINNRLTPSVPLELTFQALPTATGRKITTIFAHMATSGSTAIPYSAYNVTNIADPIAVKSEIDALAGVGSQASSMAVSFVNSVALGGQNGQKNFTNFRIIFLPNGETHFGPSGEAITAALNLRSDMFVSCYPAGDATNAATLKALVLLVSGIDRDLLGQFGSFMTLGSVDAQATAVAYNFNSPNILVAYLQDTNTATVSPDGDTTIDTSVVTNVTTVTGINTGAAVSGTGIPASTFVGSVLSSSSFSLVDANGNPVVATSSNVGETLTIVNKISQAPEIIAAGHAGALMASPFPYNPVTGITVGGLIPPRKQSDWIQVNPSGSSEACLVAGLSPLYVQPGSQIGFIRSRTTWVLLANNVTPVTNYFDWQQLVVLNDFKEVIFGVSQNPPFNGNPGGTKNSANIQRQFKDEVLRNAKGFEDQNAFQNVTALAPFFIVQASTSDPSRMDFKIPVQAIPGLEVIAGNIQAVSDLASFLQFQL